MRTRLVLAALIAGASIPCQAADPDTKVLVEKVLQAAGGSDKLLKLFRIKEEFTFAAEAKPKGKGSPRESILEAPKHWWVEGKDRAGEEQSKNVVWAWTLGVLVDPKTKFESIPGVKENDRPTFGLRVGESVKPAIDLYFDQEKFQLVRLDDRDDFYRFREWREHDGTKYPARSTIFKKADGKPWFHHEILEIERLKDLPKGLKR